MKRLTARDKNGRAYYVECHSERAPCLGGQPGDDCLDCPEIPKQCEALARYEEIEGLMEYAYAAEPNLARVRELTAADREGRVVVLPCKVGDKVYMVNHHGYVKCGEVVSIHINNLGSKPWIITTYFDDFNGPPDVLGDFAPAPKYFHIDDFGKTVFLTSVACAMAALEKETEPPK